MREQQLQKKIIDWLESQGFWTVKVITTNKRGCPDILACHKGRFIAIEVKAEGKLNTVTPIQEFQINQILTADGIAIAADSLETVKKVLDNV